MMRPQLLALMLAGMAHALPTIYIAGDSTANNLDRKGWGDHLMNYFDSAKVEVANRAMAGRSSRTFFTEQRWEHITNVLQPGDFVLIQFGHNDGGPLDTGRARGSLPGTGEETREITKADGSKETVHTYGWYLRRMIADTRAKGATPIVLSLTVRNIWKDGHVERGSGSFGKWAAEVAASEGAGFVDLTNIVADRYENMGETKVREFFPSDHTHTSSEGADFNAAAVAYGLETMKNTPFPALMARKLPTARDPALPSVILIGDSTVRNGRGDGSNGQWGWGEPLVDLFNTSKVNVVNRALGGLSSRTYYTQLWTKTLKLMKPGDVVIMQFGHNDPAPLDDPARARGTLKGIGEETREIDNPITKQHEVVHTYGWYLRQFILGAKQKGAIPIVCSPVPRKIWRDGKIARSMDYGKWAADVAREEGVAFLDLNEMIASEYDRLGPEKVEPLFGDEHTHTSRAGAELNARVVAKALRELPENALPDHLR